MKTLLVLPPFRKLSGSYSNEIPLNLLYIAAVLKKHNFPVKTINFDFKRVKEIERILSPLLTSKNIKLKKTVWKDVERVIKKESPDILGISCETPSYTSAVKVAKIAKKINKDILVVVGGSHPTALPNETILVPFFDIVVRREGELTMLELLNTLKNNGDLKKVKGIVFKKKKKIITTPTRPLIKNLDVLPFPARDSLINEKHYSPTNMGVLISGRGCPFNCAYCARWVKWGSVVRLRSPENVVNEIEHVQEMYGTFDFKFHDDTFTLNKKRVIKICEIIRKRKLDIIWGCVTRADRVNRTLIKKMKSAGCRWIFFGVESGSQEMLNKMRRGMKLSQIRKAIKICKDEGLIIHASFMIGYPGESKKTLKSTFQLIKELKPDFNPIFFVVPFPGTELSKYIKKEDLLTNDYSKYTYEQQIIKLNGLTSEELYNFYRKIIRGFRKKWVKYYIKRIKQDFPFFMRHYIKIFI